MAPTLGRMTVLVEDYEEALEYYTETLGLEVLSDTELENGFRAFTSAHRTGNRSDSG